MSHYVLKLVDNPKPYKIVDFDGRGPLLITDPFGNSMELSSLQAYDLWNHMQDVYTQVESQK